jgi:ankyrin repeat protein
VVDTHAHRLFAQVSLIVLLSVIENDTKSRASILADYEDVDDDDFPLHSIDSNHDLDSLLYYATHFWLVHFRHARIELFDAPEWILTKRLFDPVSHCTFFRICSTQFIFMDYEYDTPIKNDESESKPGDRLYHASFLGFTELVEWLLQEGGNPNASSGGRCTYPLIVAAAEGHEAVIGLLLDSGAEVDARDICGNRTALYWAVRRGHEATMRLLLNRGAALFDDGFKFTTPLHEAAIGGHESLVRMLIQAGEDVNKQGGEWGYPLQAAASSCNQRIVRLLLENGALISAEGGKYGSALQAAAYSGRVEIVQFLLEKGADINAEGGEYGCALQAAAAGYQSRVPWLAQRQDCVEVAQLLLDKGANVNAKGGKYGSALRAAKDGHFEDMVRLLLENGARD